MFPYYLLAWTWAAVTTKLNLEQLQQQIPEYRHQAASSLFGHSSVYVNQAACFPSTLTMASFILAMDKVQPQFSNLYWADQQHSTSEGPCRCWRCLPACRHVLLKFSVFSSPYSLFHKLNDLDCHLLLLQTVAASKHVVFDQGITYLHVLCCVTLFSLSFTLWCFSSWKHGRPRKTNHEWKRSFWCQKRIKGESCLPFQILLNYKHPDWCSLLDYC